MNHSMTVIDGNIVITIPEEIKVKNVVVNRVWFRKELISSEDLKPCPCCGGKAEFANVIGESDYFIHCLKCDLETTIYPTQEEAMEAWNRRVEHEDNNKI